MKPLSTILLTLFMLLLGISGCDLCPPDEEYNTGEIIKDSLKSPSSFRKLDGKMLWRGKNDFGDSFVVRIAYEAKN